MPVLGLGLGLQIPNKVLFSGILDTYSGASVAYSLRKLRSGQVNAIRVRESSGNTEADIGFVGDTLDTAALLAHCGANDGFIVTWYDQSGNGNDATQSTTTEQPRIVNAGVVEVADNGLPALLNQGVADNLEMDTGIALSDFSAFYVVDHSVFGSSTSWMSSEAGSDYFRYDETRFNLDAGGVDNGFITTDSTLVVDTDYLISTSRASNVLSFSINGTTQTNTDTNSGSFGVKKIFRRGTNTTQTLNGFAQEFILYPTSQASNKAGIESNINDHYSIY